jgi:hypothetical protein
MGTSKKTVGRTLSIDFRSLELPGPFGAHYVLPLGCEPSLSALDSFLPEQDRILIE